ncbi:hypothetical protein NDN01_18420 [Sphingomonas sp. QA11]|uniref:hypothetical protein n=1 Tax=Sphingomonas sp. QA11 TaxID=2950605 RepID=UPI00234A1B48|nr:hypothetical protein [Sphingomonas sp. QA11]WCM25982.1 hypothetical protein NDN01_18420 [Sphingomonas sp. QA11]
MLIEDDDFPMVRLHYNRSGPGGLDEGFTAFEAQLNRARPFVLIGHGAGAQAQDHEERKRVALWMKRHREPLRQFVLALVYVEPQAANRFVARSGAETYAKFWGYPMLVTASDEDARAVAARLLAGEPAATIDVPEPHDPGGD